MADADRIEQRARMGLRLIMKLHESYPQPTALSPQHAFAPGEKSEIAFQGGQFGGYEDKDVQMADGLASRMLAEGVIEGERSGASIWPAVLPARTRRILGTRDPNSSGLLSETVRNYLATESEGRRVSAGEFTRIARLLDFEP